MDLFNNGVGAEIRSKNAKASKEEIQQLVRNALIDGKLRVKKTMAIINQEGQEKVVEVPADKDGKPIYKWR